MVRKIEKIQMRDFIAAGISQAHYSVKTNQKQEFILATDRQTKTEYGIILVHTLESKQSLQEKINCFIRGGFLWHAVFYGNETTFLQRADDRVLYRNKKSLERYTQAEINEMIVLRDLERLVYEKSSDELSYYRPNIGSNTQKIEIQKLKEVILSYDYLPEDHRSIDFAEDRYSGRIKIAKVLKTITHPIYLKPLHERSKNAILDNRP
jgi:hypothetical protein